MSYFLIFLLQTNFLFELNLVYNFYNFHARQTHIKYCLQFLIQNRQKQKLKNRISQNSIQNNKRMQKKSDCPTSVLVLNKSIQKLNRVSSKRKLLISPSKDLLVFFSDASFNKFNPIKQDNKQKKGTKLTLNRTQTQQNKNTSQKNALPQPKQSSQFTANLTKQKKILSVTTSAESLVSSRKSKAKDENFLKLKKEVDQIRRKYSSGKMKQSTNLNKIASLQFLKSSASNNSLNSLNTSKQKIQFSTPKNDRYLGKRILTKNIFSQNPNRLRLTQSRPKNIILKNALQKSIQNRKNSIQSQFYFQNLTQSVNLKQAIQDTKMTFQFTFGSMALMDFQNMDKLRLKQKTFM